jgi:hypothetical protein
MNLDRVTITGADHTTIGGAEQLLGIARRYPFVEWGILLSKTSEGRPRFPPLHWIEDFLLVQHGAGWSISGHLCGSWVRDLCSGGWTFCFERPTIAHRFDRLQLNFHASRHDVVPHRLVRGLQHYAPALGYILQFDDVNNGLLGYAEGAGVKASPLFDISGGAGVLPDAWPKPVAEYNGYAGGLSPTNLLDQLHKIEDAAGDVRVWIDVETHVRTVVNGVESFDPEKVERFLEIAAPWVRRDALV